MSSLIVLLAGLAQAQDAAGGTLPELNAQTFQASMDSNEFTRLLDTDLSEKIFSGRGVLHYTDTPLQYTWWDDREETLVGGIVQLDAIGTWTNGPVRVGVAAPIILRSFGGSENDVTALGDLAIEGKIRAVNPEDSPVGVALAMRTQLPTGTGGGSLSGGLGLDAMAAIDTRVAEKLTLALNAGIQGRPALELEEVQWGTTMLVQGGAAYEFSDRAGMATELISSSVLADLGNILARPAEAMIGGWVRPTPSGLVLRPAVAVGLSDAITTPRARVILSVTWADVAPPDIDQDGIIDSQDACPEQPEDFDTFEDEDGCPEIAEIAVRVVDTDGFEVPDLRWTSGSSEGVSGERASLAGGEHVFETEGASVTLQVPGGGTMDALLEVPAPRGKLEIRAMDEEGNPVEGAKWVASGEKEFSGEAGAVLDVRPGDYTLDVTADGYRPVESKVTVTTGDDVVVVTLTLLPAKAQLSAERIDIKDTVYFETAKAIIQTVSYDLLDEVADILNRHPEITKMRIEGHTDSQGSASSNQKLSQARAESVVKYLVDKGVAAERLSAEGFGESKPLVVEKTAADRAKNRRVSFFVEERSDD